MSSRKSFLSTFAGFFSGSRAKEPMPAAPVVSPVDLNVPVTNPRLTTAILKHQQFQANETAMELFGELKEAMLLVPVILNGPPSEISSDQSGFKKGDTFAVIEARDNSDNRLLGLFTDHLELQRHTNSANSTFVMPAKEAMMFVLDKGYAGLVINPAGQATLRLDASFIRTVLGSM